MRPSADLLSSHLVSCPIHPLTHSLLSLPAIRQRKGSIGAAVEATSSMERSREEARCMAVGWAAYRGGEGTQEPAVTYWLVVVVW